ncbi:MAG TPA: poly-gamma-glutamate hydrolase family protein [Candidatus Sericytochromatia bacterium]|jgi:phage replication-related protein YjqB (UPF0714/DUF867 family)
MAPEPDIYKSMTALYSDPSNVEGTTYAKRWKRHEWSQMVEKQATDAPETQKIVMAIHGGGIEPGTSEIALAVAGYHPDTLVASVDDLGLHDFWLFEGLLPSGNGKLHVTASHYDDPIATELVQNARRCISLHGCSDTQAKGKIQIGGRDLKLRDIVLEELTIAGIPAEITTNQMLGGCSPDNIANKTKILGCVQLEMGTSYRSSLFGTNTQPKRKKTTNTQFWLLVGALRKAMSKVQ